MIKRIIMVLSVLVLIGLMILTPVLFIPVFILTGRKYTEVIIDLFTPVFQGNDYTIF